MPISRGMHRINLMYKFNRCVPHKLTQAHTDRRVQVCTTLLEYQSKDNVLDRINTCDESGFTSSTQTEEGTRLLPVNQSAASQSAI
ncbi:hypothetical protein TNCT_603451 [Trichonephila clavata]|uniref:Uncharacterized protein n=1 Tax=Trichonephila clavata TaxID=2740835 RepID=A0A8X6H8B1_TRICU|nr:hypothetical protein TNCT_603451 [Trichonephila clavata]